jgi:hypothetical protein
MNAPEDISRGPDPEVSIVVYDRQTGDILTIHHFSTTPRVSLPPEDHLHDVAVRHALLGCSRDRATIATLRVDPRKLIPERQYRVSIKDSVLIELPIQS